MRRAQSPQENSVPTRAHTLSCYRLYTAQKHTPKLHGNFQVSRRKSLCVLPVAQPTRTILWTKYHLIWTKRHLTVQISTGAGYAFAPAVTQNRENQLTTKNRNLRCSMSLYLENCSHLVLHLICRRVGDQQNREARHNVEHREWKISVFWKPRDAADEDRYV